MFLNSRSAYKNAELVAAQMAKRNLSLEDGSIETRSTSSSKVKSKTKSKPPLSPTKKISTKVGHSPQSPSVSGYIDITVDLASEFSSIEFDTTIGSIDDPLQCKEVMPERKAKEILVRIQRIIDEQREREETLNKCIKTHQDLAKARHKNDNEMGAIMSVRKIKKLEAERTRVVHALDVALGASVEIEAAISRAKSKAIAERDSNKSLWFLVEIGEQAQVFKEVDRILHTDIELDTISHEEALQQLHALM